MFTYKELCKDDEEIVSSFFDKMGGESRAMFNRRDYNRRRALKYCSKPDPSRLYFGVYQDENLIGIVFFIDFNTAIPELGLAILDSLSGQGLGREIAEFAIEKARESGCGGIFLTTHTANVRAQALYEKLGFKLIGLCKDGAELAYILRFSRET